MNAWFYRGHLGLFIAELETMKIVIERILSVVDDEVASAGKRFRTQSEEVPDEGLDAAREDLWVSQDLIPRYIINSLFASLFSLFEDEMVKICERIDDKVTASVAFRDYKDGIGLSKCMNYLTKILAISVDDYHSWREILDIKGLRNMIMHNNGRFEDRNEDAAKRLQGYVDVSAFLSIDEFRNIIVDRRYLEHVEEVFRTFIKELIPELEYRKLL
jgi:hypothetical protein